MPGSLLAEPYYTVWLTLLALTMNSHHFIKRNLCLVSEDHDIFLNKLSPDQAKMLPFTELFFFAYRDFVSEPDSILHDYGFGRAHHRVLHFVSRNPGLKVSELLDILKITKQSLARILKQLIDEGFIEQKTSPEDKRARFLYATTQGIDLMKDLITPQLNKLTRAVAGYSDEEKLLLQHFFLQMIAEDEKENVTNHIFNDIKD